MLYRAMQAADLYRAGWAPEIWITRTDSPQVREARALIPGFQAEHDYSREVLKSLGIEDARIRIVDPPVINTLDEVHTVLANLNAQGGHSAILVTSPYHTRRVKITWAAVAEKTHSVIVRACSETPYDPGKWWRNTRDVFAVAREVGRNSEHLGGFSVGGRPKLVTFRVHHWPA